MSEPNNHQHPSALPELPLHRAGEGLWDRLAQRLDHDQEQTTTLMDAYYQAVKTGLSTRLALHDDFQFRSPLGHSESREEFLGSLAAQADTIERVEVMETVLGVGSACARCQTHFKSGQVIHHSDWFQVKDGQLMAIDTLFDAAPHVNQMIG